ncbi:MAG: hypothetical protein NT009_07260, partial [Proteobacteria bacterium]|nr:hypothetical protein [Pseudomonadota bacterium]
QFTLADETLITLEEDTDLPAGSGISQGASDLNPCSTGADPWDSDCYLEANSGQIVMTARTGPGEIALGPGVTGGSGLKLEITGGPIGRRYKIQLFRG